MQETLEGTTLGRYQLQRRIGRGGMAEVYLAYDEHLRREIAVKIVHRERGDDLARFQREVATLAPLTHEHILPVYDYGQEGPWHYLVMPYIAHGTLADRLHVRGALTPVEAGFLTEQIASALQYAHDHGILHRDIKPSNILLRDDSYAYLADFGIAKSLERESGLTLAGTFIGTPEYMAPELFESQGSRSSDIYALGIVLYFMLTNTLPFTGPSPLAVVQKQVHALPVPPTQLNPAVTLPIERVVLCALEKDPQKRFPSAQALANACQQAMQASPAILAARPGGATPGFYADTTMAVRPDLSSFPGQQHAAPQWSPRARRALSLMGPALLILLLVLGVALFATMVLGNHARGSQPGVSTTTTAAPAPTLTPTATQPATTCVVNDSADILDQNQVCQAARSLAYSLVVNTSNASGDGDTVNGPQTQFIDAHTIVIAIVATQARHGHNQGQVMITGGSAVPLTNEQYHNAVEAFIRAARAGDYTSATIAAIQSLQAN